MKGLKQIGFMVLTVLVSATGARAQEPALNIQAPATAPILEAEPVAQESTPAVKATTPEPAPKLAPAEPTPPVRAKKSVTAHTESITTDKVVVNTPTNRADHIATNTVATPVPPVATPPKTTVALATNAVPSAPENDRFFKDTWKNPSFVIGTRALVVSLQDTTRGTPGNGSYFGTITEITENQDTSPDKLYIQARIYRTPIWVGVSYDHISARTMDDGDGDGIPDTSGGDGDEELEGFIPYLQAAWNNQTRFTPYGQIGYAFYQAEFVPNSWGDNGRRYVEASSSASGLELGAGLSVRLYRNLSADVFVKSQKVSDITGDWYYNYGNNYGGPFIMTMSYVAYGAGLSCRF